MHGGDRRLSSLRLFRLGTQQAMYRGGLPDEAKLLRSAR